MDTDLKRTSMDVNLKSTSNHSLYSAHIRLKISPHRLDAFLILGTRSYSFYFSLSMSSNLAVSRLNKNNVMSWNPLTFIKFVSYSETKPTPSDWEKLLKDILDLQSTLFDCITKEQCYEVSL